MPAIDPIREGHCYRWGSRMGSKPVHVWVGHIDSPEDLNMHATEPVVSCIVQSMRPGMPTLNLVPVYLSAMLADPFEKIPTFDVSEIGFGAPYQTWRRAFGEGTSEAWSMGPADVYAQAMRDLLAARVGKGGGGNAV